MPQKLASTLALLAFAACLYAGGVHAGNSFGATVQRALLAMLGTLVIGLIVGAMAQRMLDENLKLEEEKMKNESGSAPEDGR